MVFCIENDFAKYFAKCNLFKYFVSHTMIIFRNDTFPYYILLGTLVMNVSIGGIEYPI